MNLLHPSFARLHAFAAGTLDEPRRAGVARHLESCARCRAAVGDARTLPGALACATDAAPSTGTWDAIAARVASGETVILPAAGDAPARTVRRGPWMRIAAAVLLLLVGGAALGLSTREAVAVSSELVLSPAAPVAGSTVQVTYRSGGLLSGADRLVLRGRMMAADDERSFAVPVAILDTLRREGDAYVGSFTLPDSIVYAVFAVEDEGATRVDDNGEQWELMVHDRAGQPLADALLRRAEDVNARDSRVAVETARRMTELYPDRTEAWMQLYFLQLGTASKAEADSLARVHRARVQAISAALRGAGATPEQVAPLLYYAGGLGDTATVREWRVWMYAHAPRHPVSAQHRAFDAAEGGLAALDRLWAQDSAGSAQIRLTGFQLAMRDGNDQAMLAWGNRMAAAHPMFITVLARSAMQRPGIRPQAMDATRRALRYLESVPDRLRPLTSTREQERRVLDRARGQFLGMLGRALVEGGHTRAGLDTLSLATRATWDPRLFRGVADARLLLGDTTGALPVLARVAADPETPAAFADTARQRLGRGFSPAAWTREVAAARAELRGYVMEMAVDHPVRGPLNLTDLRGAPLSLEARHDAPTLVAFWSRWCMPSRMDLENLERVSAELRRRGARVVTVTDAEDDGGLDAYLRERGFTFPVYLDPDKATRRALQNRGTPHYLLLGADGRIRFDSRSLNDAVRQVEMLHPASDRPRPNAPH
ncbi:MAG TPA: redoxin domain-containing protein [Longimicrobium sp.]|jgi:thiol-disulfide isomerase/thioredoxin|uniref:redoxin domain-containing protein n=1 Tax=Longimicrobium sp. TaxID=2029185 RepID=UPI002ED9AEB8